MRGKSQTERPLTVRLARIAGQVRGVRRMIRAGRPCQEVAGQISAIAGALKEVQLRLVAAHLRSCLPAEGNAGSRVPLQRRVDEISLALATPHPAGAFPKRTRRVSSDSIPGRPQRDGPMSPRRRNRHVRGSQAH